MEYFRNKIAEKTPRSQNQTPQRRSQGLTPPRRYGDSLHLPCDGSLCRGSRNRFKLPCFLRIAIPFLFCYTQHKAVQRVLGGEQMLEKYYFSKAIRNPYAAKRTEQVTILLKPETADYFRALGQQTGIPYQTLINLYLADCAEHKRKLTFA